MEYIVSLKVSGLASQTMWFNHTKKPFPADLYFGLPLSPPCSKQEGGRPTELEAQALGFLHGGM